MSALLQQKLDSDDESADDDYVPSAKEISEYEREVKKNKPERKFEEKRAKKIDDLWKEMNQDPSAATKDKTLEAEKVDSVEPNVAKQTPTESEKKDDQKEEMPDIKKLLAAVNNKNEKDKTMKFAGKEFVSEGGQLKEVKAPEVAANVPPSNAKANYLKNVLSVIDSKNINSMTKSKYDWKEYTTKNKLEKQFNENRKDGYLEKKIFLEQAKQNHNAYISSKKKKIDD